MLVIDDSRFPLVWLKQVNDEKELNNNSYDVENTFSQLKALFARKTPFILINGDDYGNEENHAHSKEEKMIIVKWMKNNKPDVRNYIIAQVQVIPKEKQTILLSAFSKTFSKFWGFPLIIASNKDAAIEKAHELLKRIEDKN
ncbi:hypothetical protein [Sodalis sp. RH19]|uniref:hypothetical protein n=1 Tax=unclassified Sodalis (in: enterobacteria) TaxID=2636512 RepID=UPI0039B4243F